MWVHSKRLSGTQFFPVNVFEGELPLMLFSLHLRWKSILELSQPAGHTGATSVVTYEAPASRRGWRGAAGGRVSLTYSMSRSPTLELIANPIKTGKTAYWFTPLNTHDKQMQRKHIVCKFTHKWLPRLQNILKHSSSCQCPAILVIC